jgi:signal transduction histidine kinase
VSSKAATKRQSSEPTPLQDTELSRHLLNGEEEERRRISRELHDETGQALMILRFHLEMLAAEASTQEQKAKVQESLDVLDRTIEGVRRIIARLSPRVLDELGLVAAIRRQAQQLAAQTKMRGHLELPEHMPSLSRDTQVGLYRSVQEALHNIAKHSQAKNFWIRMRLAARRVVLEIEDDGIGVLARKPQERGFGLTGMRERTAALCGSMTLHSRRSKGTHIRITLPYAEAAEKCDPQTSVRAIRRGPTSRAS